MTPDEQDAIKRARRGRNRALALVLLGLVVLFYAIAWAKIAG
jgi:cytochrome c oxidase assembly protein Cox11